MLRKKGNPRWTNIQFLPGKKEAERQKTYLDSYII